MADQLRELIDVNFLEYASYVIKERAIPHINDGFKPVQRRILHTMSEVEDGKFNKVANVVGRSMQYHPHGDASIFAALVVLANKEFFIDKQGNFGNIYTGDSASAARYIECRLTPLAKEVLFNREITDYEPSYDGRNQEPVTLPAKIPVLLLQGAEGIAVGMSTSILPHNFNEVLDAQVKYLRDQPFRLIPDFPTGGTIDARDYDQGNGKVKVRAHIEARDEKHLVIREIPYGTNTEKLINSIENAIKKGRIKVSAIQDYTAENVEIELSLPRGVYADQVLEALYAFTDCEISHSVQMVLIHEDNKPHVLTVNEVLKYNTDKLLDDLRLELEIERGKLRDNLHFKTLEQIFIENRIYKNIEEQTTYEKVIQAVYDGFVPFEDQLIRAIVDEDVERLLQIRIKRISRFDINKSRKEIEAILARIDEVNALLADMVTTTINYITALKKKFGKDYPRRTKITELETVDRTEVAIQDLKLGYDRKTGYLGTEIKTKNYVACSQFHKILVVTDKYFKVIPVAEKLYIKEKILYVDKVDQDVTFNCVYREQTSGIAYMKRFKVEKFIMEKEYAYLPEESVKILLFQPDPAPTFKVFFPLKARARVTEEVIDLSTMSIKGFAARGNRVSPKPVVDLEIIKNNKRAEAVDDETQDDETT